MESTTSYGYDVFLSFRGDMRYKFTSHLDECLTHAGFVVFKDNKKMVKGEVINEALQTAINSSRICMPIFSKNYASSKACLWELSHMVQECKSIIPIFYDVGVDDVELKTDLYKKALEDHHQKGKVGKEEVEKWKMALLEVCKILGYNIVNRDEADQITKITREVLNRLMPKNKNVTTPFVEIDDQVESVIEMLDLNSNGCRIIGVCGMGGIGKTTLAKVVYNRISSNFNNHCTFIVNVRESEPNNQLPKLQEQLYKDLIDPRFAGSIDHIDHGINMIKKGLENNKFLLVLDDVDNEDLLKNLVGDHTRLASGSRIIITTRNKRILKLLEQDPNVYEVRELDEDRALQLFSWHAFKSASPLEKFESLSKKVVSFLGGLPLALEVIGSSLLGRSMKAWEDTMERLKEAPNERIHGSLMISYNRLHKDEHKIFVDIACFPRRIEKTQACYMWASSGWRPYLSLDNLINQSLVKVEVFRGVEWLWMHDVLKDFGRDIIRNECEERFLQVDENFDKISNEERKHVEMLQIQMTHVVTISSMDLEGFENVRFIELERSLIEGNFEGLLPNLKWISIRNVQHFMAVNFNIENLVVLQLFSPYLEILDIQIKGNKLKVLDFSYCGYMKQTPSFKELPSLEMLVLDWCIDLIKIDNSIGELKKLICFSMRECWSLQCLPEDIGNAKALEKIVLIGNNQRFELPCSIGNLGNLLQLQLIKLDMGELPASIENLMSLYEMDLSYTGINKLPDTIGQLKELRKLRMNHSKIRKFPTTFGKLVKLEELEAKGCENFVGDIPSEICMLPRLRVLNLRETPIYVISELSSSLRCLLIYSDKLTMVFDVSKLKCLSKLELISCQNVVSIVGFDGLNYMEELCIRKLRRLSSLKLWNCKNLKSIVGFDGLESLTDLSIRGCSSIKDFSFLYDLTSLSSLELWNCRNLKKIDWFKGLESLINLSIRDCPSLEEFPFLSILVRRLSLIELMDCKNLKGKLVFLGLQSLRVLTLQNLRIDSLELLACGMLRSIEGLDGLESLTDLSIEDCPSLRCLPNLSTLKNLKHLTLRKLEIDALNLIACGKLESIDGLDGLESLTNLSIKDCPYLRSLPHLSTLGNLLSLTLCKFERFECIHGVGSLLDLFIKDCPSLRSFPDLLTLGNLGSLTLRKLERLECINKVGSLTHLSIEDCPSLRSLPDLSMLGNLGSLTLSKLERLEYINRVGSLTHLSIEDCPSLRSLHDLSTLGNLGSLTLRKLERLECINKVGSLTHLSIEDCPSLRSFPDLLMLGNLGSMTLHKLEKLECINKVGSLIRISIEDCPSLRSLPHLSTLGNLRSLTLCKLERLEYINKVGSLTHLSIKDCPSLRSLPDLSTLGNLKSLRLCKLPRLKCINEVRSLTHLSIEDCPSLRKVCLTFQR